MTHFSSLLVLCVFIDLVEHGFLVESRFFQEITCKIRTEFWNILFVCVLIVRVAGLWLLHAQRQASLFLP